MAGEMTTSRSYDRDRTANEWAVAILPAADSHRCLCGLNSGLEDLPASINLEIPHASEALPADALAIQARKGGSIPNPTLLFPVQAERSRRASHSGGGFLFLAGP